MKRTIFVVLVVVLAAGADGKKDEGKKDQAVLQGDWTVAAAVERGKANDDVVGGKFTFDGEQMVIQVKDREHRAKFTLDPTKDPKQIDVTMADGPEKDKILQGIYSVTKDEVKICIPRKADTERPTAFESKEGTEILLITLKRAKG